MSGKIKQLAPQIWKEIQKANKILLHCHPSPDGDSLGSVLAMKLALEAIGKQADAIWGDSRQNTGLTCAPGYETVLEKNWFDIDISKYDLFIILDSAVIGQISSKGEINFPSQMSTVVIDHHKSNPGYAKINLIVSEYPATCQIVFDLFGEWGITLTKDIALNLFMGIFTDTGGFKEDNVIPDTFFVAGELARTGANFSNLIFSIEKSWDPKFVEYMGAIFSSIEHFFQGKVAVCTISYKKMQLERFPAEINGPDLADLIKSAKGNNISVTLKEKEPNVVGVSMRRRDNKIDLSKIAVATGSGGGHPGAAGATIKMPLDQAKEFLLKTIQKVYPDLGEP